MHLIFSSVVFTIFDLCITLLEKFENKIEQRLARIFWQMKIPQFFFNTLKNWKFWCPTFYF